MENTSECTIANNNMLLSRCKAKRDAINIDGLNAYAQEKLHSERKCLESLLGELHLALPELFKIYMSSNTSHEIRKKVKLQMDAMNLYIGTFVNLHLNIINNRMSYLENERAYSFAKRIAIVSIVLAAVSIVLAVVALCLTSQ